MTSLKYYMLLIIISGTVFSFIRKSKIDRVLEVGFVSAAALEIMKMFTASEIVPVRIG